MTFFERALFYAFAAILTLSSVGILFLLNKKLTIEVPAEGGSIIEGVIGTPRFVNPLLAITDADRDMTALVYSGLMKATPDGSLIPDLAESFSMSADGLTYTFTIRDEARFHDGEAVTAEDVVYTIAMAEDSILKSPKRANWEGVSASAVDERTVTFTLPQPYSAFLENTTMGILPRHLWEHVSPEQFAFSLMNIEPVGSGPYRVMRVRRDSAGIPREYALSRFKRYALGAPYIPDVTVRFYTSENELLDAFERGDVRHVNAILPSSAKLLLSEGVRIESFPLPRIFGVFFNQNRASVFTAREVRGALATGIDKERIVREVLEGYGVAINGPLPPGLVEFHGDNSNRDVRAVDESPLPDEPSMSELVPAGDRIMDAQRILEEAGWKRHAESGVYEKKSKTESMLLEFTLATGNAPELKRTAEIIAEAWRAIGADVDLVFFEAGNLNQDVIRPREYDALLFGQIIGRDLDPFAFWHSSQRNDPGLNIALYTNITVDKLLEDIRATADRSARTALYRSFDEEIQKDQPAVFVYSPDFIYVVDESIRGFTMGTVTTPSERFLTIHEWHVETDRLWKIFANKEPL